MPFEPKLRERRGGAGRAKRDEPLGLVVSRVGQVNPWFKRLKLSNEK